MKTKGLDMGYLEQITYLLSMMKFCATNNSSTRINIFDLNQRWVFG